LIESGFVSFKLGEELIAIDTLATLEGIEPLGDLLAEFLLAKLHQFVSVGE